MKTAMSMVGVGIVLLCLVGGIMYGVSWFSQTSTALVLNTPKPGVTCASMVTANGVALSCWKD